MKKRTVILISIFTIALVGGGGYGIYRLMQNGGEPVEVISVANINQGYYGGEMSSSGTITSKATQEVHLDSNELVDQVFVKEGDKVKVGDKLLAYDTTLLQLNLESYELEAQAIELELKGAQNDLKKLKSITPVKDSAASGSSSLHQWEDSGDYSDIGAGFGGDIARAVLNPLALTAAAEDGSSDLSAPSETVAPETAPSETAAPETTAPETVAPETTAPETTAPETAPPETAAPETAPPETAAPETTPVVQDTTPATEKSSDSRPVKSSSDVQEIGTGGAETSAPDKSQRSSDELSADPNRDSVTLDPDSADGLGGDSEQNAQTDKKVYKTLNERSKPISGEGTKENPYVFVCKGGVIIQSSFLNKILGFREDVNNGGFTREGGGMAEDGKGCYATLEIRKDDTISGEVLSTLEIDGTKDTEKAFGEEAKWKFAVNGIQMPADEATPPADDTYLTAADGPNFWKENISEDAKNDNNGGESSDGDVIIIGGDPSESENGNDSEPDTEVIDPTKDPDTDAPGTEVIEPGTESDTEVIEPGTESGTDVTEPGTEPGTEVTEPGTESGTDVTEPGTEPGTDVTEPGTEPGTDVTEPGTEPGTEVIEPGTEPGTDITEPGTEPGTDVTEPGTEPGTDVTEPSTESEEPEPSPLDRIKAKKLLTYNTKPYKGTGTKEDPYVFFCADGAVIRASFMNKVLGFNESGTSRKGGGMNGDGEGCYVVLEIREGDEISGGFIKSIIVRGNTPTERAFAPDISWIFTTDGLQKVVPEVPEDPDEDPEDPGDWFDPGDWPWDDGDVYTESELRQAIEDKEKEIKDLELSRRESDLKIQQAKRKLEDATVVSSIHGVVKSVGDPMIGEVDGQAFILVTSDSGLYVQGTLSEQDLDKVKVGSIISGLDYQTYTNFTAEITEISKYPGESNSWYGDSNPNASSYPFLAYIEETDGLSNYDWVELKIQEDAGDGSDSIYIEKMYVRKENGQSYVYIKGEDGRLKKQYVRTGKTLWGSTIEIKEGLTINDSIAFPYGKNVKEGAKTKTASEFADDDDENLGGAYEDGGYEGDFEEGGYEDGNFEEGGYEGGFEEGGYEEGGYEDGNYEEGGYEGGFEEGGYEEDGYEDGNYEEGGYDDVMDVGAGKALYESGPEVEKC